MIAVTTVHKAPPDIVETAKARAAFLGLPYLARQSTFEAMETGDITGFLVYGKRGPALWADGHEHLFHTGTAKLRFLQMKSGGGDRLCALLPPGTKTVLDCTFGEGKDALVLSWHLGGAGRVTALEKSPALWEVGQYGLSHFVDEDPSVTAALRRIALRRADFRDVLRQAPDGAWDVVYFDTMFRRPVKRAENNREAFRSGACYDRLDAGVLREAARAARLRVIVKERPFAEIFRSGLFREVHRRRGQTVAYGVMDAGKERP